MAAASLTFKNDCFNFYLCLLSKAYQSALKWRIINCELSFCEVNVNIVYELNIEKELKIKELEDSDDITLFEHDKKIWGRIEKLLKLPMPPTRGVREILRTFDWFSAVLQGSEQLTLHKDAIKAVAMNQGILPRSDQAPHLAAAGDPYQEPNSTSKMRSLEKEESSKLEFSAVSVLVADFVRRRYPSRIERIRSWMDGPLSLPDARKWLLTEARQEALAQSPIDLPEPFSRFAASAADRFSIQLYGEPGQWPASLQPMYMNFGPDDEYEMPFYVGEYSRDLDGLSIGTGRIALIKETSEALAERYRWSEAEAAWFLLCDEVPQVYPFEYKCQILNGTPEPVMLGEAEMTRRLSRDGGETWFDGFETWTHPNRLNRITMTLDPMLDPEKVKELFIAARESYKITKAHAPGSERLRLVKFAFSKECIGLSWEERKDRWLKEHPESLYANYQGAARFRQDAYLTRKAMLFPGQEEIHRDVEPKEKPDDRRKKRSKSAE